MKKLVLPLLVFLGALMCCSYRHVGPKDEVAAREALDVTGRELAKKHQIELLNSGLGTALVGSSKCLWALNFISRDKWTIEQVRPIVADITKTLLAKMYNDPLFATTRKISADRY